MLEQLDSGRGESPRPWRLSGFGAATGGRSLALHLFPVRNTIPRDNDFGQYDDIRMNGKSETFDICRVVDESAPLFGTP